MKNLIIINNEKVFTQNNNFFCDNLDLKILPEELNNYHKVEYIVRSSNKKKDQKINLENIKPACNIFKFIFNIYKTFKKPNANYLLICITPYTFISFLILYIFKKNCFTYLFSSGHEEYKHILGSWAVWIYDFMFKIVTSNSKVIVCHERLFDTKKSHLVNISRLDNDWLTNRKKTSLKKIKYLYVGRMSIEKGIFDFISLFNDLELNADFSIVGNSEEHKDLNNNINFYGYIADPKKLIDIYDEHNITVLPSYTEATPYTVDESLARNRPVIIFEDIDYIVKDKKGIFISKRNIDSFSKITNFIIDNYEKIQRDMEKNLLPTKKSMIKEISEIIKLNK